MRRERQIELLERVAAAGPRLEGLHAPASVTNPASAYVDAGRFDTEMAALFRGGPVFVGLSDELREPGSYRAMRFAGVPIVVVRQADGSLCAMVNSCRHRGAPLVEPVSRGGGLTAFSCPYHAWTYELSGELRARPLSAGAFDDVTADCDLLHRPVAERHGMIFVRPEGDEPIDVDGFLSGAEDDLAAFGLDDYVYIESRTSEWAMNWKCFFDTFSETYHIRTLHRDSIAPLFNSDCLLFEPFGRHALSLGLRADFRSEFDKPKEEWSILPHGTIQYFLVPNALVVHQVDHLEVWTVEPLSVGRTRVTASVYAPTAPENDRQRDYFVKNLDLLNNVTTTEDFPLVEQIQQTLASGALPELIYGRIEPPLIHFHRAVDEAIGVTR